jgi:hypothetical protein
MVFPHTSLLSAEQPADFLTNPPVHSPHTRSWHLSRSEDSALAALVQLALIVTYTCALIINTCNASSAICSMYGLGETASGAGRSMSQTRGECSHSASATIPRFHTLPAVAGLYVFFVFFGLGMVLFLLIVSALKLYLTGNAPTLLLVAQAHGVPLSTIISRVSARRCACGWRLFPVFSSVPHGNRLWSLLVLTCLHPVHGAQGALPQT